MPDHGRLRRTLALARKEFLQIVRDPSSILIAFVLPVLLILLFGYGINLDATHVRIGLVVEDGSAQAARFASAYEAAPAIRATRYLRRQDAQQALVAGVEQGVVVVPEDFSRRLQRGAAAPLQVLTDGSDPNTAAFLNADAQGAWARWLEVDRAEHARPAPPAIANELRYWYNPAALSRNFLVPGSIVIILSVVGALLTSLVVAREWERGTMEALLATPVTRGEFLLSKLIPYYVLGMASLVVCTAVSVWVLGTPLRGSLAALAGVSTLFLASALGLGLLLSTALRNQFNAAQAALNAAFLPAVMLSGFIYEIHSMPTPVRLVTYLLAASYYVNAMQTLFLAGDIPAVLWRNAAFLAATAAVFLGLTWRITRRRLD